MKIFLFVSALAAALLGATFSACALDYTAGVSLSLSEQYNDNIFLSRTDRTTDYITLISPAISLSTKTEKMDLGLSYSPTFNLYKDHDENNSTSHQASILGHYKLTDKLTLGLSDTFVQTREAAVIRSVEGAGPITNSQQRITTNSLTGDLSYKLTGKISLLGNAAYSYTSSETGIEDVSTYGGGVGASYLFNERTTFRVNATYTLFDYKVSGNSTSNNYTAGINYRLTPTITVDAFGGVVVTRVDEPKRTDTGFSGGLSVTKNFERGTASLAYLQDVIAGVESASPIRSQTVTLRYTAPVTTSLGASISAFYSRYKSIGSTGIGGIDNNRNDAGSTAELSYGFLPWLSGTLSYSYIHSIDKSNDTGSYVNNIVMAGIKLAKQSKF